MKIVIRAGGVGTRLWPMSRASCPKQFQALINDLSLIKNTFNRVKDLGEVFISVHQSFVEKLKKEIPEILDENIIIEPISKNTGPAICLEVCSLAKKIKENEIIASLPSDDFIEDEKSFRELLINIENFLKKNSEYIVVPGVMPFHPDPEYSYLKKGKEIANGIYEINDWVEKPESSYCKEIISSGEYFAHTGMYFWQLKTIINSFQKIQPEMYKTCSLFDFKKYVNLEAQTIEKVLTSKIDKLVMSVSDKMGWSDLGKWQIIKDILPTNQGDNLVKGLTILEDTTDCLIYGLKNKLIATIGLDDMIIVDTPDALLICPKKRASEVKEIVEKIKKKGMISYL